MGPRIYHTQSTAHSFRHKSACNNRQLCGLSTDSLAWSPIHCRYILPFLCIMFPVCGVLWVRKFHHRYVIMAKYILEMNSCVKFYKRAAMKSIWEIKRRPKTKKITTNRGGNWWWDWSKCTSEGRRFRKRSWCCFMYKQRLFHLSLECTGGPKHLMSRKQTLYIVTLFPLIQMYKRCKKYFVNFKSIPAIYQ